MDWDEAYSVQCTSDGGYILAGVTESSGAGLGDMYLVKVDSDGNPEWEHTYGGMDWDEAYSVQCTSDGGYILAGWTMSYSADSEGISSGDMYLVKVDSDGNEEWAQTYGGENVDMAASVQCTMDDGYILGGWSASYGTSGKNDNMYLVKVDGMGNIAVK